MSRGGRGGGRGGRGGGRGGRPNVPWDTGDEPDARPSELFPHYAVPTPRDLTATERSGIQHFLLLRHQIHASPLYTSRRTSSHDPSAPRKTYGQPQVNALYGVRTKASVDPFTAMPMYSHRFAREGRALPDWSVRPVCRELFPAELHATVAIANGGDDGDDDDFAGDGAGFGGGGGRRKRRRLELSKVTALPDAEEAFGMRDPAEGGRKAGDGDGEELDDVFDDEGGAGAGGDAQSLDRRKNLLERRLANMGEDDGDETAGGPAAADIDEEEGGDGEDDVDDEYDDEDAGDYDAENYFDNGDEMGEDYGDGDDGEGTF